MSESQASKNYSAENIKVLEGLEAVRKKTSNVYWGCWQKRFTPSNI